MPLYKKTGNIPRTEFSATDKTMSITKNVSLNMTEFNQFLTAVSDASGVSLPARLSIFMNVTLNAKVEGKSVEKTISPHMELPIGENYFTITKTEIEEPAVIELTATVPRPLNLTLITLYALGLIAALASLYFLIKHTCSLERDLFTRQLNRIFKKYGNRLVALNTEISGSEGMRYKVRSIEDLVRVADEIGKPIMYKFSRDHNEIEQFFVMDDQSIFFFNLGEALGKFEGSSVPKSHGTFNWS